MPTFENLVTEEILPPGTLLSPVDLDRDTIAEITEDGYIQVGEHLWEKPDRAAREDHADVDSGWETGSSTSNGETDPVLLADLRLRATESTMASPADGGFAVSDAT